MSKLLALGDSFTAYRYDGDNPWGCQLAKMLDVEHKIVAHEGAGNMYMYKNAFRYLHTMNDISHVVLALSNWDRLEIGPGLGLKGKYKNTESRCKNMKPKVIDVNWDSTDNFSKKMYYDYYDPNYYYDVNIAHLIAIQSLCKSKNIKLKITQLIEPFHPSFIASMIYYKQKTDGFIVKQMLYDHIEKCDMLPMLLDTCGYTFTPENISRIECNKNDLQYHFTGKNSNNKNVMGFHDTHIYHSRDYDNYKTFDFHPTNEGHKLIADKIYECFNT